MMYNRILIALDGSPFSESVFQQAMSLAQLMQARLMLLYVAPVETASGCTDADLPTCSMDKLRSHRQTITAAGLIADIRLPSGNPGDQICQVAQTWGADLILMGHHSLLHLNEHSTNSVSHEVIEHAPCSLLIVPDHLHLAFVNSVQSPQSKAIAEPSQPLTIAR